MKKLLAALLLTFVFAPVLVLAYTVTTSTGTTGLLCIGAPTPIRTGQSFTTVGAGTISSITAKLANEGTSPVDNTLVNIFATDGSGFPTGSSLGGQASLANSTLTGSYVDYTFNFTPFAVTAATKYAIVFSRSGAANGTNFACNGGDNADTYAGGAALRDNAGTWATLAQDFSAVVTVAAGGGGGTATSYMIETF